MFNCGGRLSKPFEGVVAKQKKGGGKGEGRKERREALGAVVADQAKIFSCPVVAALWILASAAVALGARLGGGWNHSFSWIRIFLSEVW